MQQFDSKSRISTRLWLGIGALVVASLLATACSTDDDSAASVAVGGCGICPNEVGVAGSAATRTLAGTRASAGRCVCSAGTLTGTRATGGSTAGSGGARRGAGRGRGCSGRCGFGAGHGRGQ